MGKYINEYFDILEIYEDAIKKQDYKNRIHKSMIDFIKTSSAENAF